MSNAQNSTIFPLFPSKTKHQNKSENFHSFSSYARERVAICDDKTDIREKTNVILVIVICWKKLYIEIIFIKKRHCYQT